MDYFFRIFTSMSTIAKKLNFQQAEDIHILNKPDTFDQEFKNMNFSASLLSTSCVDCVLVFTETKEGFMEQMLTLFPRLQDSSTIWVAYPSKTTKKELVDLYSEFDWDFLGYYRLKPIRLTELNSNWNAIKLKKASA